MFAVGSGTAYFMFHFKQFPYGIILNSNSIVPDDNFDIFISFVS